MGRPISLFPEEVRKAFHLLLGRERELNSLVGELSEDGRESLELVLNLGLLLGRKEDLEELRLIKTNAGTLADDLGGVDDVLKDGVVDSGHGAGTRAADAGLLAVLCRTNKQKGENEKEKNKKRRSGENWLPQQGGEIQIY